MAKITSKNAILLINGSNFSSFSSAYNVTDTVDAIDVTGFTDGAHNFIAGQRNGEMSADMFWDADTDSVHDVLSALPTGYVTILPEGYTLGAPTLSLPFVQANYQPSGAIGDAIKAGSIKFMSRGNNFGVEYGVVLHHATETDEIIGTGVLDPTNAAVTAECDGVIHVWDSTSVDEYQVKIQHSADNITFADLITFTVDGTTKTAERITRTSGTINKYRRVLTSLTGGLGGESFGFTVHFFHK